MPFVTVQTRRISQPGGDWAATTSVAQTDPALNVLSATLSLTAGVLETVQARSLEGAAAAVQSQASTQVRAAGPDGTGVTVYPVAYVGVTLGAATGGQDGAEFAGTGTGTASGLIRTAPGTGANFLVGTGTAAIGVVADTRVQASAPGNVQMVVRTQVGATLRTEVETQSGLPGGTFGSGGQNIIIVPPPLYNGAVTTAAQTQTLAEQRTGRTGLLTFQQFDPSLGILLYAGLTMTVMSHGTYSIENDTGRVTSLTLKQDAYFDVLRADGSAAATAQASSTPPGIDLDATTALTAGITTATSMSSNYLYNTDLAQFAGTGSVVLALAGTGLDTINGPSAFALTTGLTAGVTVALSYTYLPGGAQAAYAPDPAVVAAGETSYGLGTLPALVAPGGTLSLSGLIASAANVNGPVSILTVNGAEIVQPTSLVSIVQTVNGTLLVAAGGAVSNVTVTRSGVMTVDGQASFTTLAGLGIIRGESSDTTITGTAFAYGQSVDDTVNAGGRLIVSGLATGTRVLGGQASILAGGSAATVTIGAGGVIDVATGATLTGVAFAGAGTVALHTGAVVTGITGFGASDVIDLVDTRYTDTLPISRVGGQIVVGGVSLALSGGSLRVGADAAGTGTAITLAPALGTVGDPGIAQEYRGPVGGIDNQYLAQAPNAVAAVSTDNWYLHSNGGVSAFAAHGGRNVLDAGTGSAFLVGGTGQDTFFVSAGAAVPTWTTVVGHAGDDLTMWGFGAATPRFLDGQGAAGYTGLTLAVQAPGGEARVTLAGYTMADLVAGRVTVLSGTDAGSGLSYLNVRM